MDDISSTSRIDRSPDERASRTWRPERCDRVALVLQGGGALGAYQAGVYQAMHESGLEPDWVSGVSIGAINAAIIAGNPPNRRLRQLRTFWERITERKIWPFTPDGDVFRKARNATSCWLTMMNGQPGFFAPRFPNPWLSFTGAQSATSCYDNSPLQETLSELVDFSLRRDAAGDRQPPRRRQPYCTYGLHRDSTHQTLCIDVRVEKSAAEGFQCPNHVKGRNGSLLAPAVDRNPAASRIKGKDESRGAECFFQRRRVLGVDLAILQQGRAEDDPACARF